MLLEDNVDISKRPKSYALVLVSLAGGLINHGIFLTIFSYYNIIPLYYFNYFSISIFAVLIFFFLRRVNVSIVMMLSAIEIFFHQILCIYYLGWDYGFQFYILLVPSFILLRYYQKIALVVGCTVISLATLLFLHNFSLGHTPVFQMIEIQDTLYIYNLLNVAMFLAVFNTLFAYSAHRNEEILLSLQKNLYKIATTDFMTKLSNRMDTSSRIEQLFHTAKRNKKPFVLAIADIDDFKIVNDTYGHDVGDLVIIEVAQKMKNNLRAQDLIGRWGGEEFLIALPDTNIEAGKLVLNKLLKEIVNSPINTGELCFNITITIGATLFDNENVVGEMVKSADNALYIGKKSTKNCVVF